MRNDIHPKLTDTKIICHCGYESVLQTTKGEELHTEICSNCHPFYTGKQRLIDTAGRIDRFRKKYGNFSATGKK
ncbi:MAG: 50S ribosomal protein L31 [Desulfovibrio sp.]